MTEIDDVGERTADHAHVAVAGICVIVTRVNRKDRRTILSRTASRPVPRAAMTAATGGLDMQTASVQSDRAVAIEYELNAI